MQELRGQVALVTGSARGIGRGIALVLAERGADVVINDKTSGDKTEAVASQIRDLGRRAIVVRADLSLGEEVNSLFETIEEEFGRLDILVNNAGTSRSEDIFETSEEDWQFIINTNLTSCFLCSKAAMKIMAARKRGRIVSISSVVAQQGALFGDVHYAASKSGILGLTKTLARTAAPLGITVNAIAPGCIETELLLDSLGADRVAEMAATIPLGLGKPHDIGLTVAFLSGEGGRYITGATIDVNGGLYLR